MSRFSPVKTALPPIETYTGIIVDEPVGPPSHGPASTMSYTVYINFPDGPQKVTGLKPVSQQWPDTIDVMRFTEGTAVLVANVAGQLQMTGTMIPYIVPCNQNAASIEQDATANLIGTIKTMTAQQKQIVAKELGL